MPNYTETLKLIKPTEDEFYNIAVPNANMDALDTYVRELQEQNRLLKESLAKKVDINEFHGDRQIFVMKDGSNSTGDGSIDRPYQTIVHAIRHIRNSAFSNFRFFINIGDGIYDELVYLDCLPMTTLRSISENPNKVVIDSTTIPIYCSICRRIDITNLTLRGRDRDIFGGIVHSVMGDLLIDNCIVENVGNDDLNGIYSYGGNINARYGTKINNTNVAIRASENASIVVADCTGTGNKVALAADAGTIFVRGTVPEGATARQTTNGGQILG